MNRCKQQAVCILGMHRSGTSALARAVNLLGAYLGPEEKMMPPQQDNNPEGFWEHVAIVDFHDRLLRTCSRFWDSVTPLPDRWWVRPEVKPYRDELYQLIVNEFGEASLWMWKDPRTTLCLPLWKEVLAQLAIETHYVICLRHPFDVTASLQRRDGFSRGKSLALWQLYNLSAFYWTYGESRWVVSYDRFLTEWEQCLTHMREAFPIPWPSSVDEQRAALSAFLQPGLRHSRSDVSALTSGNGNSAEEVVARVYRSFLASEHNDQFLQSEDFHRNVVHAYEEYCAYAVLLGHEDRDDLRAYTPRPALEVFWRVEGEFSQAHAVLVDVKADGAEHEYECILPLPLMGLLRLDPVNFPAYVELRGIELGIRDPESSAWTVMCSWGAKDGFRDVVAGPDVLLLDTDNAAFRFLSSSGDAQLFVQNIPMIEAAASNGTAILRVSMRIEHRMGVRTTEILKRWREKQQRVSEEYLQEALALKDSHIQTLETKLQAHEQARALNESHLQSLEALLQEREATLSQTAAVLHTREARLVHSERRIAQLEDALSQRFGVIGYLKRVFRWPRVHKVQLEPVRDIEIKGKQFCSIGNDPQFRLQSAIGRLPTGWVEISYLASSSERWMNPRLYADMGLGFSEDRAIVLTRPVRVVRVAEGPTKESASPEEENTSHADVQVSFIICLPNRVRALRLDPLASQGSFVLQDLTIREIGVIHVITAMLVRHLQPLLFQPGLLWRTAKRVWRMGRTEGLVSLRRQFLLQGQTDEADYEQWVNAYDTLTDDDRAAIFRHLDRLSRKPLLSVVMPVYNTPERILRQAIDSVRKQLYPTWELCIADDASTASHMKVVLDEYCAADARINVVYRETNGHISAASNSALTLTHGEFVVLLDHDDELAEHALYCVAVELNAHPDAAVLYSDEDKITEQGVRHEPYFKPDWNPDLFFCQNMVSHLGVYRTDLIREVGGFREGYEGSQDWDLAVRVIRRVPPAAIRHIPQVLYHWRVVSGSTAGAVSAKRYVLEAQTKLLHDHFCDQPGVQIIPAVTGYWRVKYPLPQEPPLVSLIIPTRNRLDLLARCVDGIYRKTRYQNFELLIVDNQSDDPATLAYLRRLSEDRGARVLRYDAPFNYSAINNFAVQQAQGEVVGFLNNDLDVISSDWLEEMVSHACRAEIGAVGAMLYYPDDTIQHAGVILGVLGVANHAYAHRRRGFVGQLGRARLQQNLSAVTAACLVVRRSVFLEAGGFDEENLGIAFNDVDLCLRIREKGYRNLWTPYAELYHYESASRGYEDTPEKQERFKREIDYMLQRWGPLLQSDPAYNPNLTLERADFSLAFPPRVTRPWEM
ncbi:MAG: glycosyltransferase [Candidatus Binatia bacterium]